VFNSSASSASPEIVPSVKSLKKTIKSVVRKTKWSKGDSIREILVNGQFGVRRQKAVVFTYHDGAHKTRMLLGKDRRIYGRRDNHGVRAERTLKSLPDSQRKALKTSLQSFEAILASETTD